MFDNQLNLQATGDFNALNNPVLGATDASAYDYLAQICKQQVQRGLDEAKILPVMNDANKQHMEDQLTE